LDNPASPVQIGLVTASALLAAWIGILGTLRRGPWLTTLLFSSAFLSIAGVQAGVLGLLNASTPEAARTWAEYLAGASALASWLWLSLSVVLARPDAWLQVRQAGAYLSLALVACVAMFMVSGSPLIVRGVDGRGAGAVVVFGGMGKIYLMYLVVAMVAVLMNLERMLRDTPASSQDRVRPMFMAILGAVLAKLVVVSGALLYGGLRAGWLAASGAPLFVAGIVIALSLARRRLSDMSVPVARPVLYYSSVSLTLAGLFLLTMAVLSKVLPELSPAWRNAVALAFYALVAGGGLLLVLSPGVSRAVKRFVDRNFYANRYDYRREWERVSTALTPTASPSDIARQIESLLCSVFEAGRVAVYVADERDGSFQRLHGPSSMPAVIPRANALVEEFRGTRQPVLFAELADDLAKLPLLVENRGAIQALDAAVCAPLQVGDQLAGMVWLSRKRGDDTYTMEDVEFLGAVSRQLAAALAFARQAEQLAQTRQLESLNRLSSLVLHDIKNQVSGLSLMLENSRRHIGNPEFQRDALAVVERSVGSLRDLMSQVASVARAPEIQPEPCSLSTLVRDALAAAGLEPGTAHGISVTVEMASPDGIRVDRRQLQRVLVNLLTNAREALVGHGTIALQATARPGPDGGPPTLCFTVRDDGRGMSDAFLRDDLFRPFRSTKPAGLGIGLVQARGIVEAHGGSLAVESRPGGGTTFEVVLPGAVSPGSEVRA
jgi:hypothetical protein